MYWGSAEAHEVQAIAKAVSSLPCLVLWKLAEEDKLLLGDVKLILGNNVHLLDFAPQNDILGDPSTRVFVSHGGINSMHEVCSHP